VIADGKKRTHHSVGYTREEEEEGEGEEGKNAHWE